MKDISVEILPIRQKKNAGSQIKFLELHGIRESWMCRVPQVPFSEMFQVILIIFLEPSSAFDIAKHKASVRAVTPRHTVPPIPAPRSLQPKKIKRSVRL